VNEQTLVMVWLPTGALFPVTGTGYRGVGTVEGLPEQNGSGEETTLLYRFGTASVLANEAELVPFGDEWRSIGDSIDIGFLAFAYKLGLDPGEVRSRIPVIHQIPYESERRYSAAIVEEDGRRRIVVKGALETLLRYCTWTETTDGPAPIDPGLVERAFDAPPGVALREHIFTPLGLASPFVAQSLDDARQLTPGYSRLFAPDEGMGDVRARYHPGWVSHGVVISTALDLARALDGLLSGSLLSAASRAAMLQAVDVPVQHPLFGRPGYGLGLMIDQGSRYGMLAGHGGGGPGYAAGVLYLPDANGRRITSAALANSDQGDAGLRAAFDLMMLAAQM
jgi:hypothetical protein